ncbi:MAG TPA: hypothetical protein PLF86_00655 [Candidatus Moranbacteria bacterium]|nr:hypothetical protein [Candidatus Moranbacteria bacterium]
MGCKNTKEILEEMKQPVNQEAKIEFPYEFARKVGVIVGEKP